MSRRRLIAANWKMHPPPPGWDTDDSPYRPRKDMDVVIFPTFLDVRECREKGLITGAQCGRPEESGAFTGDVSMAELSAHGCRYVLCGHSERRRHHGETDAVVLEQARAAEAAGLIPVVCIGETEDERTGKRTEEVLRRQLHGVMASVIAYEPVWAIGSGKAAGPDQAQQVHAFLRSLLPEEVRESTRIIYGGSVKSGNAGAFLREPDIDGLLIGGASIDPQEFQGIIEAAIAKAGA